MTVAGLSGVASARSSENALRQRARQANRAGSIAVGKFGAAGVSCAELFE
jgi:bifunctional ADP-heptose synthase (sugar kinase/adenylyltransferase)